MTVGHALRPINQHINAQSVLLECNPHGHLMFCETSCGCTLVLYAVTHCTRMLRIILLAAIP